MEPQELGMQLANTREGPDLGWTFTLITASLLLKQGDGLDLSLLCLEAGAALASSWMTLNRIFKSLLTKLINAGE